MHAPHIFGCGIDAVQQQQGTKERADVETKQSWNKRKLKNYRPRHAVSDLRLRAPPDIQASFVCSANPMG
jgi:hypothetical protein